jgi:hypothetical protein
MASRRGEKSLSEVVRVGAPVEDVNKICAEVTATRGQLVQAWLQERFGDISDTRTQQSSLLRSPCIWMRLEIGVTMVDRSEQFLDTISAVAVYLHDRWEPTLLGVGHVTYPKHLLQLSRYSIRAR